VHPWVGLRCAGGLQPGQGGRRAAVVRCGPDDCAGLAVHPWVGLRCVWGLQPGQGGRCAGDARCGLSGPDGHREWGVLRGPGVRNGTAAAIGHHAVGGRHVAGARRFRRARGGRSSPQRVGHGATAAARQADVGQCGGQSGGQSGQACADPFWGRRGWPGVCCRLVCGVVAWRIPCGRAAGLSKREGADVATGPPLSFG
jgi:hypothetical protein